MEAGMGVQSSDRSYLSEILLAFNVLPVPSVYMRAQPFIKLPGTLSTISHLPFLISQ